jgi:hypothetical protein
VPWREFKQQAWRRVVLALTAVVMALVLASASGAAAHDIPADVRINAFLKPAGHRLELLIRVPMAALIEAEFPTRGPGYLEVSRADEALRGAARLYLIDNITITENGVRLPPPHIAYARVSLPSDRSFASYQAARAHVAEPRLADDLNLYWDQQLLDVLLEYPIRSDRSQFAIHPRFDRFGHAVSTALVFRRTCPRARSNSRATPAWCVSTRAGTRRRCGSSSPASGTSSKAATICSSCAVS